MTISLIAARSTNDVIGRDNDLPWRLPDDLRRFRRLTRGHAVIMGRKTHESIGRPLPRRLNIVLSRGAYSAEGCLVVHDSEEALTRAREHSEEIFVIGGGEIYRHLWPLADRIYLTQVDTHVEGDVTFPEIDPADWTLIHREDHPTDADHALSFSFQDYVRRRTSSG